MLNKLIGWIIVWIAFSATILIFPAVMEMYVDAKIVKHGSLDNLPLIIIGTALLILTIFDIFNMFRQNYKKPTQKRKESAAPE